MPFRAADIEKLLDYLPMRTSLMERAPSSDCEREIHNLITFMYTVTSSLVSCLRLNILGSNADRCRAHLQAISTYALEGLLPQLDRTIDLEFNAHFLDRALAYGLTVVECPVMFYPRSGESKDGTYTTGGP